MSPADLEIRILQDLKCQPKPYTCKALLNRRQVPPLDSDFFFWKLPDLDFPFKIKHSTLRKKHETKSYMLSHNQGCLRCVFVFLCFFCFFCFSWFSSFLCFSLVCVILVRFKVKDAARIDTAFAKVFVSNSLCYCEFLVFLAHSPRKPRRGTLATSRASGRCLCTQFYELTMFWCFGRTWACQPWGPRNL